MKYFEHEKGAYKDNKIKFIISKFGAVGYAVWFVTLELLAEKEDMGYIEIYNKSFKQEIKRLLNLSDNFSIDKIFFEFARIDLINKQMFEKNVIFIPNFITRHMKYMKFAFKQKIFERMQQQLKILYDIELPEELSNLYKNILENNTNEKKTEIKEQLIICNEGKKQKKTNTQKTFESNSWQYIASKELANILIQKTKDYKYNYQEGARIMDDIVNKLGKKNKFTKEDIFEVLNYLNTKIFEEVYNLRPSFPASKIINYYDFYHYFKRLYGYRYDHKNRGANYISRELASKLGNNENVKNEKETVLPEIIDLLKF